MAKIICLKIKRRGDFFRLGAQILRRFMGFYRLTQFNKVYFIKITNQNPSKSENGLADSGKITNFAINYCLKVTRHD